MRTLNLKFVKIDDFNQPIFVDPERKAYYGTNDVLFSHGAQAAEVVKEIKEKDVRLVYFGMRFNCEPMGFPLHEDVEVKYLDEKEITNEDFLKYLEFRGLHRWTLKKTESGFEAVVSAGEKPIRSHFTQVLIQDDGTYWVRLSKKDLDNKLITNNFFNL